MFDLTKTTKLSEWPKARQTIEAAVQDVLGTMPSKHVDVQMKTMDEMEYPGYVRRRVNFFVEDWDRIPAWLFVPEGKEEAPAILCCHDANEAAKDEMAGLEGDHRHAFAQHFAELGYVTLAIDCITAGDRVSSRLKPYDTAAFYKDHPKRSVMGKMLWDHIQALDLLCELKRVDSARLGVIGHGLGGANALLLAAFDDRVRACVASCAFTRFADDTDPGRWARSEGFVKLPALRNAIKKGEYPFDWEHILALAAPNPVLLFTAVDDPELPKTESCQTAVDLASRVYKLLGAANALENHPHEDGRCVSTITLQEAGEWFERWL